MKLSRELAIEQAIDARDELLPHLGRGSRQRHQDAPALLGAGNIGRRRVEDAADPGPEDGRERGVERYLARSCSTSMPVICSTFSLVRRQFFSLRLFPKIASLSQGSSILLAAV